MVEEVKKVEVWQWQPIRDFGRRWTSTRTVTAKDNVKYKQENIGFLTFLQVQRLTWWPRAKSQILGHDPILSRREVYNAIGREES